MSIKSSHFNLIVCAMAVAISAITISPSMYAEPVEIRFKTGRPSQVSLGVYDSSGAMLRQLLVGEKLEKGTHAAVWDGLDAQGLPVEPDNYEWRLVSSPGLKSKYLLSLGTSFGHHSWPGQHGGPNALDLDDDILYMASIANERSPQWVKLPLSGEKILHAGDGYEGWPEVAAIAVAGDKLFQLYTSSGLLYVLDKTTGEKLEQHDVMMPFATLDLTEDPQSAVAEGVTAVGLTAYSEKRGYGWVDPAGMTAGDGFHRFVPQDPAPTQDEAVSRKQFRLDLPSGRYNFTIHWGDGERTYEQSHVSCEGKWRASAPAVPAKGIKKSFMADIEGGHALFTFYTRKGSPQGWAIRRIEARAVPDQMDAEGDTLLLATSVTDEVQWRSSKDLTVQATVKTPDIQDLKIGPGGSAYVLTENRVISVSKDGTQEVKVRELERPDRLGVDPADGTIFVSDRETLQILKFNPSGELVKRYGRKGGRRFGPYVPTDFLRIGDIEADGKGGFIITENSSAPRRTAHVNAAGELVNEWYGGQQFYTFASPDPEDPSIVWMDSEWHWMMKVRADYDAGTWEVLETYSWTRDLPVASHYKMAERMHVIRRDLDGDGQTEPLLWSEAHLGLILRPAPEEGKLLPFAMAATFNSGVKGAPRDAWYDAIRALDKDPEDPAVRRAHTAFTWADQDGEGDIDGDELRLFEKLGHGFNGPGEHKPQGSCDFVDPELNLYYAMNWGADKNRSDIKTMPVRGYTEIGAPIWDWEDFSGVTRRTSSISSVVALHIGEDGAIYELGRGEGDGYVAKGYKTWGGHGYGWPGNMIGESHLLKWAPDHQTQLFDVGHNAALLDQLPGQLHYPEKIMGIANDCLFVADKIVNPLQAWTTDGLYVGHIFDRRADDGLPDSVYSWWVEKPETRSGPRAAFQYDMKLGGSIADLGDGSILFFGAGLNNVPVMRVSGFKDIERQRGTVELQKRSNAARGEGTGLTGTYYPTDDFSGRPLAVRVDPKLWIGFRDSGGEKPEETADSVVWTGFVEPRFTDRYSFLVYTGNAGGNAEPVKLWLDGELILDTATEAKKGFHQRSDHVQLSAGKRVPIRIQYQNTSKHGQIHLSWESDSQPVEHVPTRYLYPKE